MESQIALVRKFHERFGVPVLTEPSLIPEDRARLRHALMEEEVEEYIEAVRNEDLENVAKELADILYAVYGTILEHGLQDVMEDILEEVHRSNMSKQHSRYKMVKGASYVEPELSRFFRD